MNNEVIFILSTLNLNKIATLDDMRPNQFLFKTLITPKNDQLLQLFITTGIRIALNPSQTFLNNLPEPIPLGSGCSLILSNKLFFKNILENSLGKKGWSLAGVIDTTTRMFSAVYTGGTFVGKADLSSMNTRSGSANSPLTDETFYFVKDGTVNLSIKGMTLGVNNSTYSSLKLNSSVTEEVQYIKNVRTYKLGSFDYETNSNLSSEFILAINGSIEMRISGSGRDQELDFVLLIGNNHDYITGHLNGGGPCSTDDLQAVFNQQLKAQLPRQIISQLNYPFNEVSVFALKNLLFPNDNFITFQFLRLPGDLLITGVFNE